MIEILLGFIFGVIGGCGIGGGSVLVPLFVLIKNVPQKVAQGVCIIAFLPMSISAIIVNAKNKNIDYKSAFKYIVPGVITAIIGANIMGNVNDTLLRKCFGGFLIVFALWQFITIRKDVK